jgi:pimeloyl-ACP methyl ester carboxylesterase
MGLFFTDALHEWLAGGTALGLAAVGGAQPGEIATTCALISDGDDSSWYDAWYGTAERVAATARESAASGHRTSARDAFLRASEYYMLAFHPLFGSPVDPRLADAFAKQRASFEAAVALLDLPGEPLAVPLDGATIPGWFFRAHEGRAPLVVATNGYDMGLPELFLGVARAALERGYHCVIFDGPGQGRMLVEQQVTIRGDWEHVVTPVLDAVIGRDEVEADRVALTGWSLGGYLALRAASAEPRFAACIADPGLYGLRDGMIARLRMFGLPDDVVARYPDLPADALEPIERVISGDRILQWSVDRRARWVHGVSDFAGYVRETAGFDLAGRLAGVRCPTLVTAAENDPLSGSAPQVVAELTSSAADLVQFTAAEGAGDHCEWGNRARFAQRAFDWLDDRLGRND